MPVTPPPQKPELKAPAGNPMVSVLLAFMLFCLLSIGLVLLSYFYFLPIFIVGAAIFGFTGFHYLLWGWWLGRMIREEGEGDEEET